jgi:hypothetical protein
MVHDMSPHGRDRAQGPELEDYDDEWWDREPAPVMPGQGVLDLEGLRDAEGHAVGPHGGDYDPATGREIVDLDAGEDGPL